MEAKKDNSNDLRNARLSNDDGNAKRNADGDESCTPSTPGGQSPKSTSTQTIFFYLYRVFSIDARALAVFRMGLALVVMVDVIERSWWIEEFMSESGLLSRLLVLSEQTNDEAWFWSTYLMSDKLPFQWALLTMHFISACCMFLGYHTQKACFLSWIFTSSIQARTIVLQQGCDGVIRLMLFWSLFIPLGARYSLDTFRAKTSYRDLPDLHCEKRRLSIGTAAIMLQLAMIYLSTGLHKAKDSWWVQENTATQMFFFLDMFASKWGRLVAQTDLLPPNVIEIAHIVVYWGCERIFPILVFSPILTEGIRIVAVTGYLSFHLSLFVFSELGLFPIICMVSWTLFLPSSVFDSYDQFAGYIAKKLPEIAAEATLFVLAAAAIFGCFTSKCQTHLWLLPLFAPSLVVFGNFLSEKSYRQANTTSGIGLVRYLKEKSSKIKLPTSDSQLFASDYEILLYVAEQGCAFMFLFLCVLWVSSDHGGSAMRGWIRGFHCSMRLEQYWAMFDGDSFQSDMWPAVIGEYDDGSKIELFQSMITNRGLTSPIEDIGGWAGAFLALKTTEELQKQLIVKPEGIISSWYPMWRWRKYTHRTFSKPSIPHLKAFGNWICTQARLNGLWKKGSKDPKLLPENYLKDVTLYQIKEKLACELGSTVASKDSIFNRSTTPPNAAFLWFDSPKCRDLSPLHAKSLLKVECSRGTGFNPEIEGVTRTSTCEPDVMTDFVRGEWQKYLKAREPKALAITRSCAGCYFYYGSSSARRAAQDAINRCNKELGECDLYAVNSERYRGYAMKEASKERS